MNKTLKLLILFTFYCTVAASQTLDEVKTLFINQEYTKVLPLLKKYVVQQPSNINVNYWYGVSLLKTGKAKQALKYLETANKRKVTESLLPLGQTYEELYLFDKALGCYQDYRKILLKRKEPTDEIDRLITHCKNGQNMMLGIEKVCIVDSFVVDKENFLKAYKLSKESGKIYTYKNFFQSENSCNSTVYETERENRIYYGSMNNQHQINLFSRIKTTDGEWSNPSLLPNNINSQSNINYPFLLDDGVTLYYASDNQNSIGGYDIFVTRYDTNSDSYLNPDNVGMPFNSPYNDYMLAIDEYNDLGWFASDRYQPTDKVCIYVFIPNNSKQIYDIKTIAPDKLIKLAQLSSIKDTWYDPQKVKDARSRLEEIMNETNSIPTKLKEGKSTFTFVIDDDHIYQKYTDFQSNKALETFKELQQIQGLDKEIQQKLDLMRKQYSQSNETKKKEMTSDILNLENKQLKIEEEIKQKILSIRKLEYVKLNKR